MIYLFNCPSGQSEQYVLHNFIVSTPPPHPMSTPAITTAPSSQPTCPSPLSGSFQPPIWFMRLLWACAAAVIVTLIVLFICNLTGCQRAGGGFRPSATWNAGPGTGQGVGSPALVQEQSEAQMPSNFEQVAQGTPAHVDRVYSASRANWPAAAKALFAQGYNPVAVNVPGTTKARFFHDPRSQIWNPHPDCPPALLPAARRVHKGK